MLREFLTLLAQDVIKHPQRVQAISSDLVNRVQSLVDNVELDIDAPLSDEDD